MKKVMVVGDTHGNETFMIRVLRHAKESGVDIIVQVGDFGFKFDKTFIFIIRQWLDNDASRKFYWLDGNHDDHDYIREHIMGGRANAPTPVSHWHDRMFYCPRGSKTVLGESTVQFIGGAYSIDRHHRVLGRTWWKDEETKDSDIAYALNNKWDSTDYLFTHDCPNGGLVDGALVGGDFKVDEASENNRKRITEAMWAIAPRTLIHGHYHMYYTDHVETKSGMAMVIGLEADHIPMSGGMTASPTAPGNIIILDM